MLSLGHILISDLVVTNLFMHSLPGMILFTWPHLFYTEGVLHKITLYCEKHKNKRYEGRLAVKLTYLYKSKSV